MFTRAPRENIVITALTANHSGTIKYIYKHEIQREWGERYPVNIFSLKMFTVRKFGALSHTERVEIEKINRQPVRAFTVSYFHLVSIKSR